MLAELEPILDRLDRLEDKIDLLLRYVKPDRSSESASVLDKQTLSTFTTKQHAVLQMVLRDASNVEIGERLNISPDTVKTHISMLCKKAGVQRRASLITTILPIVKKATAEEYLVASKGLPKDWDENYSPDNPINVLVENREGK